VSLLKKELLGGSPPQIGRSAEKEAGDLYVPGLHALLREAPEQWVVHRLAENGEEAHGGEAART
jgi:hypothetical protein